jgi:hypothetical protein
MGVPVGVDEYPNRHSGRPRDRKFKQRFGRLESTDAIWNRRSGTGVKCSRTKSSSIAGSAARTLSHGGTSKIHAKAFDPGLRASQGFRESGIRIPSAMTE